MKSISGKKLSKLVEKKVTGSHHIYQKSGINKILSIPVHRNRDLKIAELNEDDLL